MTTTWRVFLICYFAGWLFFAHLPVAHAQEFDPEKVLKENPEIRQAIEQKIIDYQSLKNVLTLFQQGRYGEAIPLVEEVLKKSENVFGPEHAFTATTQDFLATLYVKLGKYDQAEPLQKQALEVRRKLLGPEHPQTVTSIDNLAKLYLAMGAYDKALPLFQRTLQFAEKALGAEHLQTAISLNYLAMVYDRMGAYDQALPLYQRALKINEKVLGLEHPTVAFNLNYLANLHREMGSYDKALPLCQRALEITEKAKGPDHPDTATSLNYMAMIYEGMGAYGQALPLYQRALKIREKVLGPEHKDTFSSLDNLAKLHKEMGNYNKALALIEQSLQNCEKVLGPEHPLIGTYLNNLALLRSDMGDYDQALLLYKKALQILEKVRGPEHPATGTILSNLADLYRMMGAYDQALLLQQRALKISENSKGPMHPDTANSLHNLSMIFQDMGAYQKALSLAHQELMINEKFFGQEHPTTAISLNMLVTLYGNMGAYDQALPLALRALKIDEKFLGPEHPSTAASLNNLASLYQNMDAYDKALPLHQRALKISEQVLGPEHPITAVYLNSLALLYQDMGAYDRALSLQKQALHIREKVLGPDNRGTATSLNNLALIYFGMGAYAQALNPLQRALRITEKVLGPEHPDVATGLANLGCLYLAMQDYVRAKEYFQKGRSQQGLVELYIATEEPSLALKLLAGMPPSLKVPPRIQVQYHTLHGLALTEVGQRKEGAVALNRAVKEIEQIRRRIKKPGVSFFQAGVVGGYLRAYRGLVAALAEMAICGEPLPLELQSYGLDPGAAAFAVAEATKGRVLLESMANAARQQTRVYLPAELRRREEQLLYQMASIETQWEKALVGGEEALKEVKVRRERLTGELQALIRELQQHHPLYAALHYPQPLPVRDLPLKDNEVLLEYALGDKAGYVFVVRRGGLQKVIRIPLGREELTTKVKTFMSPFINRQVNGFSSQQGKELHDLLLADPLAEVKEGESVIIVQDGILGLLPFEALVVQEGQGIEDHVYVGDRYTLTYYQSATIMALQRRLQKHQAQRPLFALGNPVFSASDPRYAAAHRGKPAAGPVLAKAQEGYAFRGLASREEWGQTTKDDQTHKAVTFPPLPQTEQEVRAIAKTMGVKPEPPDVLMDLEANETRFRQSPLGQYRYLHFATHADLPGKVQGVNEPFIMLGQVDNADGDDGMLTMSKVLGLKLHAELVVLSACLTGRGQVMEGEGVANFARAFQQAGAKSVLVSLWEVASNETVEYMTLFYAHLKEGKSRSQSLRLARQEIKAKHPQPFYWAAFILHGEG